MTDQNSFRTAIDPIKDELTCYTAGRLAQALETFTPGTRLERPVTLALVGEKLALVTE